MNDIGATKFVKSIYNRDNPIMFKKTNKDVLREELVELCIDFFKNKAFKDKIDILTLPSAWWNFEKLMVKSIKDRNINFFFYTTACEKNLKIFKVACANMPRTNKGIKYQFSERLQAERLSSSVASLYYMDVFDYLKYTNIKFDFIWLDLMTSLKYFDTKLHYIDRGTIKNSIVSITFIKGRDAKKYVGKRKIIVVKMMANIGFELILEAEYYDTSPMIQLTFKKT